MTRPSGNTGPQTAIGRWAANLPDARPLLTLTLPVLLISMDNTILGFAVPALSGALSPSSSQLLWIIDVYSFVLAGLLVTMGAVGDRIGRRKLLQFGAAGFTLASLLSAFAPNAAVLIGARAVLGIAGATLLPSTLSLIRNIYTDDDQRRTALAVWAAMFAVGSALGPILVGVLLERYWWGSVFLLGVPVTAALLVAAPRFVPESRDPDPPAFDLVSAALSMGAMFPIVYAAKSVAEHGVSAAAGIALAVGLVAGVTFVRRQGRTPDPMIDVSLFRLARFRTAVAGNLAACFGFAGALYVITQYFQIVVGMSPLRAGVQLLPAVAATILCTLRAPAVATRFGPFAVIGGGLAAAVVGFVMLAQVSGTGLVLPTLALAFVNAGLAMAMTVAIDGIIASVPPERAGAGASVSETANELGIALGTAIVGSVVAAVYRSDLAEVRDGLAAAGVPGASLDRATETLGAAEVVAGRLAAPAAGALRDATHTAFTDGMQTSAYVAAAAIAVAAAMAGRVGFGGGGVGARRGQERSERPDA